MDYGAGAFSGGDGGWTRQRQEEPVGKGMGQQFGLAKGAGGWGDA